MARNIVVMKGRITELKVDAIVAPATRMLENVKSPITKEIFAAAGPGLIDECRLCAPCARNTAMVTNSHNLDCKIIIHAVGTYLQAEYEKPLRDLVKHCLELAHQESCRSIAFPLLSVHLGIPLDGVIEESIKAVEESEHQIESIIFVVDTDHQLSQFQKFLKVEEPEKPILSGFESLCDTVKRRLSKPAKQ